MSTLESVLQEPRFFAAPADFVKQANVSGVPAYQALCTAAKRDYGGLWPRLARENLMAQPVSNALG